MVSFFDAIFLGALALVLLYLYMRWNFSYWKKRGIDCDDNLSVIFGSMTDAMMGRKALGETYNTIYEKFPGKNVVGYFKFQIPGLLVRDPEIVRRILITDFHYFHNNEATLDPDADPIMARNIFMLKDEQWKKSRALMTPAFTAGKIKAIYPVMQEVAKDLIKYIKQQPGEIHVKSTMSRFTSEIVARCAFGIEGHNLEDSHSEMNEMGKLIFKSDFLRNIKMTAIFALPAISKFLRLKMVPGEVVEFFNSVLRNVIVYRQDTNLVRNDLVQYLIDMKRKSQEMGKENLDKEAITRVYTDDDVLSGCVTFFVENYETSSLALTNVLYQLACHKDVQDKLRAEVDEVLAEGELTFEKLHAMSYLHSVYAETNRLLPVVFSMQKICTERYEMNIGKEKPLVIEKGTPVSLPLYSLHMDPKYWEDPDQFRPERFATKEDEAALKTKGVYMPFSDGPRMCPGSRIATTTVKLAVVQILSQLEILPTSRTPKKIIFDPNYFLVSLKGGVYLKFVERSH